LIGLRAMVFPNIKAMPNGVSRVCRTVVLPYKAKEKVGKQLL